MRRFGRNWRRAVSGSGAANVSVGRSGLNSVTPTGRDWIVATAVADRQQAPRADAEERIATEPLAALDGLEQEGWAAVVEAHEGADGGFEVGVAGGRQQDRVGRARELPDLAKTEWIGWCHRYRLSPFAFVVRRACRPPPSPSRRRPSWCPARGPGIKNLSSTGTKGRSFRGATHIRRCRSLADESGSRAGRATPADRCCPVSLALCAGAYWRALEARGSVRRLTGPFAPSATPACTNRWFSMPAPGGTRPDHSPYLDVGASLGAEPDRCRTRVLVRYIRYTSMPGSTPRTSRSATPAGS